MKTIKYPKKALITVGKPDAYREIHIGHLAGGLINADVFTRFLRNRIGSENVLFISGTECYGTSIYAEYLKHKKGNESINDYISANHLKQKQTLEKFQISLNDFYCVASNNEYRLIHSRLCQEFINSLIANNEILRKSEKIFIDPETLTFLNYRQVKQKDIEDKKEKKYDSEDSSNSISIISNKRPLTKDIDNYFFDISKREQAILELHDTCYTEIKKYLKNYFPSPDYKAIRITCNSKLGIDVNINGETKKLWNWIDSLIAPISYTMYHENKKENDMSGWRKWWCGEDSKTYHFMAQDNVFFYTVVEPYLIQSWNDVHYEKFNLPNYALIPMRTIFNGKYTGPFPTGELLAKKYSVESLRYTLASMGKKNSSFNPEKLLDSSIKIDNIDNRYNATLRKINRLYALSKEQLRANSQNVSFSKECTIRGKELFGTYESIMMSREFNKAIDFIEERFKEFLSDKSNVLYNTKLVSVMLHPFIPNIIEEKYNEIFNDQDLFEYYNPENQIINLKNSKRKSEKDDYTR